MFSDHLSASLGPIWRAPKIGLLLPGLELIARELAVWLRALAVSSQDNCAVMYSESYPLSLPSVTISTRDWIWTKYLCITRPWVFLGQWRGYCEQVNLVSVWTKRWIVKFPQVWGWQNAICWVPAGAVVESPTAGCGGVVVASSWDSQQARRR